MLYGEPIPTFIRLFCAWLSLLPTLLGYLVSHARHYVPFSEMEMLRESRARDKADGVDRNACIVDRNQFFNTQVTFF